MKIRGGEFIDLSIGGSDDDVLVGVGAAFCTSFINNFSRIFKCGVF